jgi:MEDS: MEthanogen/methylotroph, DcmR Sensory domain
MRPRPSVPSADVLSAPSTGHHIVQLYPEPNFPVRAVGEFVGEGLSRGEAVVVIATAPHWQALERQLAEQRFDVETRVRQGQLVIRDAMSSLPELLVDGQLDRKGFETVSGSAIAAAERFGYARLRVFGEMVDLLRRIDLAAAIRLEAMWTDLLTVKRIAMLCTYSLDVFEPAVYRGVLQRVGGAHTTCCRSKTATASIGPWRARTPTCSAAPARPRRDGDSSSIRTSGRPRCPTARRRSSPRASSPRRSAPPSSSAPVTTTAPAERARIPAYGASIRMRSPAGTNDTSTRPIFVSLLNSPTAEIRRCSASATLPMPSA